MCELYHSDDVLQAESCDQRVISPAEDLAAERPETRQTDASVPPEPQPPKRSAKDARLLQAWGDAKGDDPRIATYLKARGLASDENCGLRWAEYFKFGDEGTHPALLAEIQRRGETIGYFAQAMLTDGSSPADIKEPARTWGLDSQEAKGKLSGSGPLFRDPESGVDRLFVTVDVETALAFHQATGGASLAVVKAKSLANFTLGKSLPKSISGGVDDVFLCPAENEKDQAVKLAEELTKDNHEVRILPPRNGGWVSAGPEAIRAAVAAAEELPPWRKTEAKNERPKATGDYVRDAEGLFQAIEDEDGRPVKGRKLANFHMRIIGEENRDPGNGEPCDKKFLVEATRGSVTKTAAVEVGKFASLDWVHQELGGNFTVEPGGPKVKDFIRYAAEKASPDPIPPIHVYRHTGWAKIGEEWGYLTASGAIGEHGPIPGVRVELDANLRRYNLPEALPWGSDPRGSKELCEAVRASLKIVATLNRDELTIPALAATYRAVLGKSDSSVFLAGTTGHRKSSLAALCMQHFGAGWAYNALPETWTSTPNAIEAIAFFVKDALLVIDDYNPTNAKHEATLGETCDRIFRNKSAHAGRGRLDRIANLRPARPARAFLMTTGEMFPAVAHSLTARLVCLDVKSKDDLPLANMVRLGDVGRKGQYALAMAGFVQWLAPRVPDLPNQIEALQKAWRLRLPAEGHSRTPEHLADLAAGWEMWLEFAEDVGAISPTERETLRQRGEIAFRSLVAVQTATQAIQKPTTRFLELLRAALKAGRCYLSFDDRTVACEDFGWKQRIAGGAFVNDGSRVGSYDAQFVYLDPKATLTAANEFARAGGESLLPADATAMGKHLLADGLLVSVDRDRTTFQRREGGQQVRVWKLRRGTLLNAGSLPEDADPADLTPACRQTVAGEWD